MESRNRFLHIVKINRVRSFALRLFYVDNNTDTGYPYARLLLLS